MQSVDWIKASLKLLESLLLSFLYCVTTIYRPNTCTAKRHAACYTHQTIGRHSSVGKAMWLPYWKRRKFDRLETLHPLTSQHETSYEWFFYCIMGLFDTKFDQIRYKSQQPQASTPCSHILFPWSAFPKNGLTDFHDANRSYLGQKLAFGGLHSIEL